MAVLNIDKVQVYACTSKFCGPKAQTDLDTSRLFFFFLLLRGDIIDVVIWAEGSVSTEASLTYWAVEWPLYSLFKQNAN